MTMLHSDPKAFSLSRKALGAAVFLAVVCATAWAAPVVLTPGSVAAYSFYPPAAATTGGNSDGPVETLSMCFVTPTADDRTIVLATRNWYGYTKPVNVYYKMIGGGTGVSKLFGNPMPQMASAGGSSAILKNGTLVAAASGQNANVTTRNIVSGSFTVTSADTLRFVAGGGGGTGLATYLYTGQYVYYGYSGGGGAGYYGGGAGQTYYNVGTVPVAGAAVATGGTGLAGGAGASAGTLNYGATGSANGGGLGGGAVSVMFWNGYGNMYYSIGNGGAKGNPGTSGGNAVGYCPAAPDMPASMPLATTFDLDPYSGKAAYSYNGIDPWGYAFNCDTGGGRGQIVLQYQAPTCDLIPQWNLP
jgi:hypothetical protein